VTDTVHAVPEFDEARVIERVVLQGGQNAVQYLLSARKSEEPLFGKVAAGLLGTTLVLIIFHGKVHHSKALADEVRAMKSGSEIPPRWEVTWCGGASFKIDTTAAEWSPVWENSSITLGNGLPETVMALADASIKRLLAEVQSCLVAV
jgi:hypothetical protein